MEVLQAVAADRIRALHDRDEFFWLDLTDPDESQLTALGDLGTIDHLALDDTREFGQRIKFDDYAHSGLLVVYGAVPTTNGRPRLVEVHLHISPDSLITVRREPLPAVTDIGHRMANLPPDHSDPHPVLQVLDVLADSILDSLNEFDNEIDALQEALVEGATTAHRSRIFELRRQLAEVRQVIVPERDLLAARYDDLVVLMPTLDGVDARNRMRDVRDHLDRATGLMGSYREQLAALLDLYLTEVSNNLNEIMKRLTIIATIFLPLTFLTGFFGMNFGWLVQQLAPLWVFLVFGVGLMVASTAAVAIYLIRAGRE